MSHADTVAAKVDRLFGYLAGIRSRLYRGELWLDDLEPLESLMKAAAGSVAIVPADIDSQLARWTRLYQEEFGITCDLSKVEIPERRGGFHRLVMVINDPAVTVESVLQRLETRLGDGSVRRHLNTPLDLAREIRYPHRDGTYAIWVRGRREADREHRGKPANNVWRARINSMTLLERGLLELDEHRATSRHLDLSSSTLCAGSCDVEGNVPTMYWHEDMLNVHRCDPRLDIDSFGVREVVSSRK